VVQSSQARDLAPAPPQPSGAGPQPAHRHQSLQELARRIVSPVDRRRVKRALVVAIAVPSLLMTLTAAVLLWAIKDLVRADREVQHTGQVIAQSFETMKLILDMETGLRGYLGTGDQQFLDPYWAAQPKVGPALGGLESLVVDRDAEREQVEHIRHSLAAWQAFAQEAIQKRSGPVVGQLIDNAHGKELMDEIRDQFNGLVANVEEHRSLALVSSQRASSLTSRLGILLTLAAAAIIALFVTYEFVSLSRTYENALARADTLSHELAEREAHFRVLAEAIPQIVWTTTPDGTPQYFNQRWLDYIGEAHSSSQSWLERVSPEDRLKASAQWQTSLVSGKSFTLELRLRAAEGNYRWHLGRALAQPDETGAIVRWIGTFTDIEDQKRAEEALLRVAAIVESSDDAIFSKDLHGYIQSWNRGAERIYGYSASEMLGQHVSKITPPDRRSELEGIFAKVRTGQSIEHLETIRVRKDGKPVEVSLTISPIRTSAGTVSGASTIARDITERNRASEALRKTEKLAATGRLAGTMAHEINNPLEAITHLLYLIERNPSLDQSAREYTRVAMEEVGRIGHIAKQALGFYREALTPVDVNIAELIENVVELYAAGAQNKNVTLDAQIETRAAILAFPGEMRQVFSNLIVNAVDAVRRGGTVKIRVKHGRNWKSRTMGVRVLVSDNGPGIPSEARARIFEPFFTTKGEKGTGVGLWVSEGIIEKHRGRIRVKSSTGISHGTTFSVFLPYA
jgi:PAS domain S-box-containing protein